MDCLPGLASDRGPPQSLPFEYLELWKPQCLASASCFQKEVIVFIPLTIERNRIMEYK
jgi:hypothetical protein